jgi:hypothetical protein
MKCRPLQIARACLAGVGASVVSWPAVGQTSSAPGTFFAGGGIAVSIILAAALFKLADLWTLNLKTLEDIRSEISSLDKASEEKDAVETGRE